MITAKQVRDLNAANPFKPFRVQLSGGSHYDVNNRDMAIVEKNTVDNDCSSCSMQSCWRYA